MSPFSTCTYVRKGPNSLPINILSVFLHPVSFSEEDLDEVIAPLLTSNGSLDRVHFHGAIEPIKHARNIFNSESAVIRSRLKKTLQNIEKQVVFITWSQKEGENFLVETLLGSSPSESDIAQLEQRFSLFEAFANNGGLVTAGRGTHFTKPSGTHSLQFLRAANVLENSGVSHQLTFWLLPLLRSFKINRLIVDTSGIAPIAYAIAYERVRQDVAASLPMIESHASYGGLDSLVVSDAENTVFLISASTSGSLANKLIAKGAKPKNIFTLFFLGIETPGTVICHLNEEKSILFNGLPDIENYQAASCPECVKHSYAIPIVGDQFRTEPAKVEEITVALADFDEASRSLLDRLVSTGVFRVFRAVGNRQFELYLDIESILTGKASDPDGQQRVQDINQRTERLVRRGMPVHLHRIVPTAYPGANAIAKLAHNLLPPDVKATAQIKSSQELLPAPQNAESATLVVSGCMDDTYELMNISRDLRTVQPGGSITYVSPIFRASSDEERKRIESNLTFGDQGPKTFTLLSVMNINLPPCILNHSWQLEYDRLNALTYWCDLQDVNVSQDIISRIELLRVAPSEGLTDNLFWPTSSGDALRLSADFTMIPTRDGQRIITQSDVFAIVATLLHKYRQGVPKKPKLVYRTYERTVISPESFQRFSDGVLQAAFLRAAREGEIAYGNCDDKVSERMLAFLLGEVGATKHGAGHALMEYLIAFLIGRLTLHPTHTRAFLDMVIDSDVSSSITLIARFLIYEMDSKKSPAS